MQKRRRTFCRRSSCGWSRTPRNRRPPGREPPSSPPGSTRSRATCASIARDRVEPGGELGGSLPGGLRFLGVLDHPQEDLLQKVLRRFCIAREAAEKVPNRFFVTGQEPLEGARLSGAVGRHERLVRFLAVHPDGILAGPSASRKRAANQAGGRRACGWR